MPPVQSLLNLPPMNNFPIFAPDVAVTSNHVSNHQSRSTRSDASTQQGEEPLLREDRGPLTWLLPATHIGSCFKNFIMRRSTPQIIEQLTLATPELRAYVDRLKADSNQLHHITDYSDPGEAVTVMTALGESLIRYAGNEDVVGHDHGPQFIDTLAGLFVRIGEGIAYQQRAVAAQNNAA